MSDTSLCRRVDSNYTIVKIAHNSVFMFGCRLHCSRLRTKESARDVTIHRMFCTISLLVSATMKMFNGLCHILTQQIVGARTTVGQLVELN